MKQKNTAPDTETIDRATFLAQLGLPTDTTENEIAAILLANIGANLPLKPAVYPALLELTIKDQNIPEAEAREYLAKKFPTIPAPLINPAAQTTAELLASLDLPADTTTAELNIIVAANGGTHLPFKGAVYTALLRHAMVGKKFPENEAREYLAKKFPGITPPVVGQSAGDVAAELRTQLIKIYELPDGASEADIAAAAAAAQDYTVTDKARRAQEAADEAVIQEKVSVGLTREQAVSVIRRQREHDACLKRIQADRRPRLVEFIKMCGNDHQAARRMTRAHYPFLDGSEFAAALAEVERG